MSPQKLREIRSALSSLTDAELIKAFNAGSALRFTYRFVYQALQDDLARYDISMGMFYFFVWLWKYDGLTQKELGERVGTLGPGTAEQLLRMEKRGFITRAPSSVDRRKVHVFLSEDGRALKNKIMPLARRLNAKALHGLTPQDIRNLHVYLARIRGNLAPKQQVKGKAAPKVATRSAEQYIW